MIKERAKTITDARILVVDDELNLAEGIADILEAWGYRGTVANSAEEAIEKTEEARPDLVLMDIRLRGEMDGAQAAEAIRARFDIPVVYITGYADDDTLQRAQIAEPYGYILKPFKEKELYLTIEIALQKHKMRRELKKQEQFLEKRTAELVSANAQLRQEIAERKRAEAALQENALALEQANIRLQELDRLKSVFLASMSHELRTPLNSIIGFTSLILQGMVGEINEEQRKQLTLVKSSSDHLLNLINDILDISKIEAGKVELSLEEFGLDDVLGEVVETLSPIASLKSIEVLSNAPGGITLFSDRRRLKQVLMNLVGNAIKFTDQGSVNIVARVPNDGNLEIRVIDTGMGIREEDMNKLFIPFHQVGMSLTKSHQGTGLGLHLSKKLVNLLGGDISAKSEYGKGSEFTFTMPIRYKEEQRYEESLSGG